MNDDGLDAINAIEIVNMSSDASLPQVNTATDDPLMVEEVYAEQGCGIGDVASSAAVAESSENNDDGELENTLSVPETVDHLEVVPSSVREEEAISAEENKPDKTCTEQGGSEQVAKTVSHATNINWRAQYSKAVLHIKMNKKTILEQKIKIAPLKDVIADQQITQIGN